MRKTLVGIGVLSLLSSISVFSLSSCSMQDKIAIGLECNYAPFNWTSKTESENTIKIANKYGQYADGYDIQIAKILGEELGKEVVIVKTAWESLIPDLQTRALDLVIAGMTATEERKKSIDFSDEYYRSELVLVTKKEISEGFDHVLSPEELNKLINKQIIVSQAFTVTDDVIDIFKTEYGAIHAKPVDSFASAALDIKSGSAFAMTSELPVAEAIVSANKSLGIVHIDQEILGDLKGELGVSIGIKKGNTELQDAVNKALAKVSKKQREKMMLAAVTRSTSLGD